MPSPPKRTGSASMSLSNWPHCRSVMAGIRTRDIALSSGSSKSWMSGRVQEPEIGKCMEVEGYSKCSWSGINKGSWQGYGRVKDYRG